MNVSVLDPNVPPGRGRHVGRWWLVFGGAFIALVGLAVYFGIENRLQQQQIQQEQEIADPLVSTDSQVAPSLLPPAPPADIVDDGFIPPEETIVLPGEDGLSSDGFVLSEPAPEVVELSPFEAAIAEEMKTRAERWRKEMEDRHAGRLSGIVLSTRDILVPQAANAQPAAGQTAGLPVAAPAGPASADDDRRALYGDIRNALANQGVPPAVNAPQDPKVAFLGGKEGGSYLDSTRTQPISPFEIKSSTVIPATLITAINSDLPGHVTGQVSQNVYDTATGRHVLIPQGSRLFGEYDSSISYGQRRLLVAWRRLIFPDASTLELDRMPGSDPAGFAGFQGKVKNHYFRLFGQVTLLSALQSIPSLVEGDRQGTAQPTELESIAATNYSQAGKQLIEKNLSVQPRITVPTGYKFLVTVHRDIVFPGPWQG